MRLCSELSDNPILPPIFINRIMTVIATSVSFRRIVPKLMKFRNLGARDRSFDSHNWLKRRQADRYVEISRRENYRCRSAFKLIEIDDKYKLIKPGFKVLDVGAAPGSWSQVLAKRTNSDGNDGSKPQGMVIAVDLSNFQEIEGVFILPYTDFSVKESQNRILEILGKDEKFDFICSDMAPAACGVKEMDTDRILSLLYPVVLFAVNHLKTGGGCLLKIWEGGQTEDFRRDIQRFFKSINTVKPGASYSSSSEAFILARDFLGLKT